MNLPALELLRTHYPEGEIVAIARPWVADLLQFRQDLVDRFIRFDDVKNIKGPLSFARFAAGLGKEGFDQSFVFTSHIKGALMMALARVPVRVGIGTPETRFFLTKSIPKKKFPKGTRHQSENYLDLMAAAGLEVGKRLPPRLNPDPELQQALREKFLAGSQTPFMAVHAGAAYGSAKRWFPNRFAEVCKSFIKQEKGRVLLLGVPSESEVNDEITHLVGSESLINLCGQTSLKESIGLISLARFFLSNDSGLMHVAAAFGIPQVAIFGPTDVHSTYPHNPMATAIHEPVSCSPCFKRHCPIGHDCMKAVEVDRVTQAIHKLW